MTNTLARVDMLPAALAWHDGGLCVVQARIDGTKAPVGWWKDYQQTRPDRDQVARWFTSDYPGIGIVCGKVSDGLEMFEIEAEAIADGAREKLLPALRGAGIFDVWKKLIHGYAEWSGGGGLHLLFRIADHEVPGNTKLARRPARTEELTDDERELLARHPDKQILRTLAETRGEGGFVIVAPSHGTVHPTGNPWALCEGSQFGVVPTITWEERNALYVVVAAALDQTPDPKPAPERKKPTDTGGAVGDRPGDHWARATTWADILQPHGWDLVYSRGDKDYWQRPGKSIGISARTGGEHDNMWVWSTSTELPTEETITKFRAYAILEHGGSDSLAGAELRRQGFGADRPKEGGPASVALPGREVSEQLVDDFWDARPYLKAIRAAAHSRQRSAPAVLGVVLARVAAIVNHNLRIPPIVGADAGLGFITVVLAPSGVGKSSASQIGSALLPAPFMLNMADNLPIGTGEGMAEAYFGTVEEEDEKGKPQKVKKQVLHNAYFYVDEGQVLAEIGTRKNATLLPTIRSVFTGGTIGQQNASEDRRRILQGGTYTMGICVAMQTVLAGGLLDDADGGTPQRCLWMPAIDPTIPDDLPKWPGMLPWEPPTHEAIRGLRQADHAAGVQTDGNAANLVVAESVAREIRKADLARARGEVVTAVLDAHEGLLKLKIAALLAILDGRLDIGEEDWQLAHVIKAGSDHTRTRVQETVADRARTEEVQRSSRMANRAVDADVAVARRRTVEGARWVARKVWADPERWTAHVLRRAMDSRKREMFADALDHAIAEGWVVEESEAGRGADKRVLRPGSQRPS